MTKANAMSSKPIIQKPNAQSTMPVKKYKCEAISLSFQKSAPHLTPIYLSECGAPHFPLHVHRTPVGGAVQCISLHLTLHRT